MKTTILSFLFVTTFGLSACATPEASTIARGGGYEGLYVIVSNDCMVAEKRSSPGDNKSALGAAIIANVISQGVNYLGKALSTAGATKTWTIVGSNNIQTTSAAFPQCVIVARGELVLTDTAPAWTAPNGWPSDLDKKLSDKNLPFVRTPEFIFEGQFVLSDDLSAMALRPVIATFTTPIGTRALRPNEERSTAVFLSITPPGTKPTLDSNPSAAIVLGRMTPGSTRLYVQPNKGSGPYDSPWFTLAKADIRKPMTVHAMLSETQEESAFLTFLGNVFSDTKVAATETTALTQLLVPGAKDQADKDATTKTLTIASDVDTKFVAVLTKLSACSNATPGSATLSAGAEARAAIRAYLIADSLLTPPNNYVQEGMINSIDLQRKSVDINAACQTILTTLTKQ